MRSQHPIPTRHHHIPHHYPTTTTVNFSSTYNTGSTNHYILALATRRTLLAQDPPQAPNDRHAPTLMIRIVPREMAVGDDTQETVLAVLIVDAFVVAHINQLSKGTVLNRRKRWNGMEWVIIYRHPRLMPQRIKVCVGRLMFASGSQLP